MSTTEDPGQRVYQRLGRIDITPVLSILPFLGFVPANIGSTHPEKSPCWVLPPGHPIPEPMVTVVEGLGLGGRTERILCRKLGPRQGMPPHIDRYLKHEADWRRFQLPLVTHPGITMRWPQDGVEVHLEAGVLYEVRFDRMHEVVHRADCDRIHLQIDQIGATVPPLM